MLDHWIGSTHIILSVQQATIVATFSQTNRNALWCTYNIHEYSCFYQVHLKAKKDKHMQHKPGVISLIFAGWVCASGVGLEGLRLGLSGWRCWGEPLRPESCERAEESEECWPPPSTVPTFHQSAPGDTLVCPAFLLSPPSVLLLLVLLLRDDCRVPRLDLSHWKDKV